MWEARMDGAESRFWGMALNSDGKSFVGQSLTGVAKP
jgi:hypothetical protein